MDRPLIYDVIEAAASDERLSTLDRLLLILVTKYADKETGTNCTASNATLACSAGIKSGRAVRRSLSKLRELGYVVRRRRRWETAVTSVSIPQDRNESSALEAQDRNCGSARPERAFRQTGTVVPRTDPVTDLVTEERLSPEARQLVEHWNETAAATGLGRVIKLTPRRARLLANRLSEYSPEEVGRLLDAPRESAFLRGERGSWNGASFDWLLNADNAAKTLEGAYTDRPDKRACRETAAHLRAGEPPASPTGPWHPDDTRMLVEMQRAGGERAELAFAYIDETEQSEAPPGLAEWIAARDGQGRPGTVQSSEVERTS